MISFKEYLEEVKKEEPYDPDHPWRVKPELSGNLSGNELQKKIGKGKFSAIIKHPFYRDYCQDFDHPTAFRYEKDHMGFEKVHSGTGRKLDVKGKKVQRKVIFDLYKRSVSDAHLYHNDDGERHEQQYGGNLRWKHIRSHRED